MSNVRPLHPSPDRRPLVERMRAWVWCEPADYTKKMLLDAADEMERLRSYNGELEEIIKELALSVARANPERTRELLLSLGL